MKELKEKILYTYIKQDEYDKGECNAGVYFPTFEQARRTAEADQPAYRPYYIVECVECFTVCGVIEGMRGGTGPGMKGIDKTDTRPISVTDIEDFICKETPFRGIFISDKIFIVKDNGENEDIKDWLKMIIKEAVWEALNGIQIIGR